MDWRIILGALALSGCTNSFAKVIEVAGDVPDWYDARKAEIRGEGYPRLTDVPEADATGVLRNNTSQLSASSRQVMKALLDHPRAQPPARTPDEIRALAARLKSEIPDDIKVPDEPFLTDEEIAAMRALFEPYEQ